MDALVYFTMEQGFCKRLENLSMEEMIPYQERALRDEIDGAEPSHAIENFRLAARMLAEGEAGEAFFGMVFQDSDVAKWLEAAAYSLLHRPDEQLLARVREVVALIGSAQHADGYLNTYFTVKAPGKRWQNLREAHELYCAGHMIEAAVALSECVGETELLSIMGRMADHMIRHFQGENADAFPGHPEVELALVRLYRETGETKYLSLARQFIDARGASDFYQREMARDPYVVWGRDADNTQYSQAHLPVRKQRDAVGHAVRAVYLYAAMADIALETDDAQLRNACRALWQSITQRRMYITGGIGSTVIGEAFTADYDLPGDTAYAETCAAIGLIFFARRMLELDIDGRYADTMERALYNCAAAGVQLDGQAFFYVNPLEAYPGISGEAATHKHVRIQRAKWFSCACCPPNAARLFASLGRYAFGIGEDTVYSHLYIAGTLDVTAELGVKLQLETEYPLGGTVTYRISKQDSARAFTLAVRIPSWSRQSQLLVNGKPLPYELRSGYAYLRDLADGDTVTLTLAMQPRRIYPSVNIARTSGMVAFMRGPLVYCAEGVDNREDVLGLSVWRDAEAVETEETLAGLPKLRVAGSRAAARPQLYSAQPPQTADCDIILIPYFAWANRGVSQMRCFLPEKG